MTTNNGNRVIIHKTGEEGAFHVDAMTGQIMTPLNELPEWANGLATAMLASRIGWYEQRLGNSLPEGLRSPQAINYSDLDWVGIDEEGDEVEIEASHEYRSNMLAEMLQLDTSVEGWDQLLEDHQVGALVDYTYQTHPTNEATLAEAEGHTFEQAEKQAAEG